VKEQVAMELPVAGQGLFENEPEHRLRLLNLAEGLAPSVQLYQRLGQVVMQGLPGRLDSARASIKRFEKQIDIAQEPRIRRAGREIQIPDNFLPRFSGIRPQSGLFHASIPSPHSTGGKSLSVFLYIL
jgi:hypothetical protein